MNSVRVPPSRVPSIVQRLPLTSVAVCLSSNPTRRQSLRYGAFTGNQETVLPPLQLPFSENMSCLCLVSGCCSCPCFCCFPSACCDLPPSSVYLAGLRWFPSWSATSLCRAVSPFSSVLTLFFTKKRTRRSRRCSRRLRWLPPLHLLGLYFFFRPSSFLLCRSFLLLQIRHWLEVVGEFLYIPIILLRGTVASFQAVCALQPYSAIATA